MLGYSRFTNEYIVWTGESIKRSRALQRLTLDNRWHTEALEKVSVDIYDQHTPDSAVPFEGERVLPAGAEAAIDRTRIPKTIAIRQQDWIKFGSTPNCPKCTHAEDNGWGRAGGPHSKACVERFMRLLEDTDEGKKRVKEAKDRLDFYTAKQFPPEQQAAENRIPTEFEPMIEGAEPPIPAEETLLRSPRPMREPAHEEPSVDGEATPRADMQPDGPEGDNDMDYDPGVPMEEDASLLEPLLSACTEDVREDVEGMNVEILRLVSELGGGGKAYMRERKTKLRAIVSDIYIALQE